METTKSIDIDQNKFDLELFKELLCAALLDVKQKNGKHVVFFFDKEYEQTAIDCGFTCIGNYLCFIIEINKIHYSNS